MMNTNTIAKREKATEPLIIPNQETELQIQSARSRLTVLLPESNNDNIFQIPDVILNNIQMALKRNPGAPAKAAEELDCTMAFLDAVINRYELAR